jgi:hypothetical protein
MSSKLDKLITKKPIPVPNKKVAKKKSKSGVDDISIPGQGDWRTTDEDEINRRRLRAREDVMQVTNLVPEYPVFSDFRVTSESGQAYTVQIHDVMRRLFDCACMDFRINGLGTCKHVEAVLWQLEKRLGKRWKEAVDEGSGRAEILKHPQLPTFVVAGNRLRLPSKVKSFFDKAGVMSLEVSPEDAFQILASLSGPALRVSHLIHRWLERCQQMDERVTLRRDFEQAVVNGTAPAQVTLMPLYPYQRDGMLHLAFTGRAMLADEMGLGKTIQAIAACALLHRLGKATRVLVISPASLKTEWEEQIRKFTTLDYQIVYGGRKERLQHYTKEAPMFTLMNYEQVRSDVLDINVRLAPDIVVLDEAQRIKNWASNTARAVKMLRSPYAFVLTGTPLENRIDELYSLVDFLDPEVFGSLFRFNREFYELDDKGRPEAYRNLRALHERVRPLMLRRRKSDVEDELPERTDENRFVRMTEEQAAAYEGPQEQAAKIAAMAKHRPLRKQEFELLMLHLAKMRMICDSVYILDSQAKQCPKLDELRSILEDCLTELEVKVIIFSEWVRMLELVQGLLKEMNIGYALHTGQVSQKRRRAEIMAFKQDPNCRILLCTESGGSGLNLQNASVVINCDLPWNPAKLEQRIARAWRKHQKRAVTVINLVTENSIEHGMLETLAMKQGLSDGVLDLRGNFDRISLKGGGQSFLNRLQIILTPASEKSAQVKPPAPPDRPQALAAQCMQLLGEHLVSCEERFATDAPGSTIAIVVDRDADAWKPRLEHLHQQMFKGESSVEPTRLLVLDRATLAVVEALQAAGLIQRSERASRPLDGSTPVTPTVIALTEEEKQRLAHIAPKLEHRLKVAKALIAADLRSDAALPLTESVSHACAILSVRNRVALPQSEADLTLRPWVELWSEPAREALRSGVNDSDVGLQTLLVAECERVLGEC